MQRLTIAVATLALACGGGSGTDDGGGLDAGSGLDAASALDSGPPADTGPPLTCQMLGGECGCVSSCAAGTTADPRLSLCPQPCDDCGGCSQECCLPDELLDGGAPSDGAFSDPDGSVAIDAGSCDVLTWDTGTVLSIGASCGATPSEGSRLCLEITVNDDGVITEVGSSSRSDIAVTGGGLTCVEGMVLGRCLLGVAGERVEECASGV